MKGRSAALILSAAAIAAALAATFGGGRSFRPAAEGLGGPVLGLEMDPQEVSRFELARGGAVATVERCATEWRLPRKLSLRADQERADRLVEKLCLLRRDEIAGTGPEARGEFGLEGPKSMRATLYGKSGLALGEILIGDASPNGEGTYVGRADSGEVILAGTALAGDVSADALDWLEGVLIHHLSPGQIEEATVRNPLRPPYTVRVEDGRPRLADAREGEKPDERAMTAFLAAIARAGYADARRREKGETIEGATAIDIAISGGRTARIETRLKREGERYAPLLLSALDRDGEREETPETGGGIVFLVPDSTAEALTPERGRFVGAPDQSAR